MGTPDLSEIGRLAALARRQRRELDELRAEIAARSVIERATGILMERLGCPADEATQQLAHLAAEAGTGLVGIAADIAAASARDAGLAAAPAQARRRAVLVGAAMAAAPDAASLAESGAAALSAEGADAVAVWLLAPDGGIELAGEAGFGAREASRWRRIPPDVPSLPLRAVRQDAEFWWQSGQPPGDGSVLIGQRPGTARAAVPLRRHGTPLGALEVCWPTPLSEFPASVRALLPVLARLCAQALATDPPPGTLAADYSAASVFGLLGGLHENALFARAIRDDHGDLAGLVAEWASPGFRDPAGRTAADVTGHRLLEIYPETAREGSLFDAAAQVLTSGEPRHVPALPLTAGGLVEARIARLFDGVVIAWQDTGEADRLAALLEQAQWLGQPGGWEENLLTGRVHWAAATFALFGLPPGHPVRLADLHTRVPAEDVPAVEAFRGRLTRQHEPTSAAFRIIRANDASIRQLRAVAQPVTGPGGELIAVRGAYQDVSDRYHTQAAFTATRERLAGTEQRAREERQLALRLQQAITPQAARPAGVSGIDVAARYRPAGDQHLVGGDWYDTVLLPGKTVLLAVGDVTGHGIDAVTGMVALRNYLRGLAVTGAGPAALLTWLNSAAFHLDDVTATVVCGIYDPAGRTLRWARAGHLPPLLIRDGTARPLPPPDGTMVGAEPDASYQEATVTLQLGDAVVLFTDGLIERRRRALDDVFAHLARLASRPVVGIGEFADWLLANAPSDTGDDTCLVAVAIR